MALVGSIYDIASTFPFMLILNIVHDSSSIGFVTISI